jgi:hypothetical protein
VCVTGGAVLTCAHCVAAEDDPEEEDDQGCEQVQPLPSFFKS